MTDEQKLQHVISLFRFRLRDLTPAQNEEYTRTADRLLKIASSMPGFISFRDYSGHDGEMLVVVEFSSAETLAQSSRSPSGTTTRSRRVLCRISSRQLRGDA